MARFAWDCRLKMNDIVKELEVMLGPDTADLAIRIGLHSGPVTAGVLRGDRARFQLFGDTVNTTSRIETTGKRDKIHVSYECAQMLFKHGKQHWLTARDDKVTAKGKGELNTYWLRIVAMGRRKSSGGRSSDDDGSVGKKTANQRRSYHSDDDSNVQLREDESTTDLAGGKLSEKHERLVNWITNELAILLKEIQIQRMGLDASGVDHDYQSTLKEVQGLEQISSFSDEQGTRKPLDEVQEIITLPKFENTKHAFQLISREKLELSADVLSELHSYVHTLATMYPDNPFHNFEHASHVTMSVCKLLSRIVKPSDFDVTDTTMNAASTLHDHTYGIVSLLYDWGFIAAVPLPDFY